MTAEEPFADGFAALAAGRWEQARSAFEAVLDRGEAETAEARFGLAMALWWMGENHACVDQCSRAYALFRASGDIGGAARCAVWLAITYKSNFANFAAANGWVLRAERLLEPLDPGPMHGWVGVARTYRMTDLDEAEALTVRAVQIARAAGDVDLELTASAQLGLIRVGKGQTKAGFALIDEAMAAALAGWTCHRDVSAASSSVCPRVATRRRRRRGSQPRRGSPPRRRSASAATGIVPWPAALPAGTRRRAFWHLRPVGLCCG